jgi:hypothetical protein
MPAYLPLKRCFQKYHLFWFLTQLSINEETCTDYNSGETQLNARENLEPYDVL